MLAAPLFAYAASDSVDPGRTASERRDADECFAWTRANTGVDPVAEATRPAHESPLDPYERPSARRERFSRGYLACLASRGYGAEGAL